MTALSGIIRDMITEEGPMALDRYMALCLSHPRYGYYMTRDPFGASGDFTTAPEISQVFGELIGVWVVQAWQMMDSPRKFALVELGPGRGTLMADILRVLKKSEAAARAAQVHFVEMSPVLREAQSAVVPDATWHNNIASLPALPSVIIANEFLDALPIRQFEREGGHSFERRIATESEGLRIVKLPSAFPFSARGEGVWEDHSIREAFGTALGDHLAQVKGLALIIDYGHANSSFGDTLQALKTHQRSSITDFPGEADLTAHVDFESLARGLAKGGIRKVSLMTQGEFLNAMGIVQRTAMLRQTVSGEAEQSLVAASTRLAHPSHMGQLFKVMAAASRNIQLPYPFGAR
jgi:NADH dehydrogenase [ubiquinone] 1 alpha subcomplex assembly factor 7